MPTALELGVEVRSAHSNLQFVVEVWRCPLRSGVRCCGKEDGREGGKEGRKDGRREGGKEGRREGGKEGGRGKEIQ